MSPRKTLTQELPERTVHTIIARTARQDALAGRAPQMTVADSAEAATYIHAYTAALGGSASSELAPGQPTANAEPRSQQRVTLGSGKPQRTWTVPSWADNVVVFVAATLVCASLGWPLGVALCIAAVVAWLVH